MVDIRDVPDDDIDRALELGHLVFHERPGEEERAHHRELLAGCERIGAYDGGTLVGLMAAHPFRLSVPGAELPCPSLASVAVAPTHRRRGVLSALMAEQLARAARTGRPLAALWASEAAIYGRFGFGAATQGVAVEIDSTRPLALRITPDDRPLRLVDPAQAPGLLGPYYDRTRADRAGRPARSAERWRTEWLREKDPEDDTLGPPRILALGEPLAGYAVFRTKGEDDSGPVRVPGVVRVDELEADTPQAAAALWQCLAAVDLTGRVTAWGRPPDDPLLLFAADRDQVRTTGQYPALWLRLVDVRAALTARAWAAPVELALDVTDAQLPANAGRFRLKADPGGCTYEPSRAPADLAVEARDLAACYLGGTRAGDLVRAGLAAEHTPGAAAALDAALRTPRLPHTLEDF
ncbi:GNAT family N-acetyltransferase [Streptomyces bambusae]|uniref:GNAT family N-acetyltransferase n=1 Tax=Streptomyces bambusae TaxID=1550616 RepID=UPI001CFDAFEA|nr:GNAT family N-acetyltransferase [Streptomyces bambusae]MCB5168793.1 GNAT family N-acetyltransferase [Streptomyces bambusae]